MNANSRLMSISIMIGMLILFVGASLNALAAEVRRSPGDTLPGAVTDEWLNQLQDENGNRILTGSDPETDAFQIRTMTAFGAGDRFGNSVSSAGDVNGDGYDDLIVGAYANDGGGTDAGRAYIYFGGISFNTVPDVILTGELAGDNFGGIVSSAGDVNGDGFSDVIVSARTGPAASGRIYIFFGGYLMNNIPDVVINGEQVGDAFGTSVSDAGDVNGDGYGDIVAGASQQFGTRQGKMYVFFGGSSMDTIPDVVALGEAVQYDLGIAVSDAGDVNGDGFDDVIAGSHMYNIYGTGKAYTYFGGTSMDSLPDVTFTGLAAGDQFGSTLSGGSDVNGDGFSDVLIGMNGFNNGRDFAYIYLGGVNMDNVADVTLSEPGPLIYGFRVGMAGDMNCDGYGDVLVSAWIYNTVSKVYIYNGGPGMDNRYDMVLTGEGTNDRFGLPAVSAGDINGDGYGDIIIGAHEYNSYTGKVHVYMYGMTGTLIPDLTMNGTQNSSYGKSVSNAGDVNGDGFADFVVGAPYGNNGFGGAFIYFGGEDMDNLADVSLIGENISDNFGFCVSGAGDFNADGYSDVVVGAWENNFSTGKIYFYYGGSYMDSICDFSIIGPNQNSYFGYSLSEAGDVNGDGFGDIIVGAPASDIAYIYYGWSEHFLANLNLDGPAGSSFGISVSGDVDLNGDNFSDIAVGAYAYLGYTGRVYVYLGGTVPNPWPVLTLQGESAGGLFGHSISLIKDINGDAFGEILIGSYGIDDFTGKAYLYLGKPLLDGNVDLEIYGVVYSSFGASVCDCGDINEDGFNDFAVGAPSYNDYQGSAFIYLGGLVCDAIPDIILNGDNFSEFGASISGTGDLDGNENSDIIVGAATYNSSNGKAYVYKTSFPSAIPAILSIKDIPNDQGGYVNVKWAKSAFDQQVSGQVSQYLIERSLPPALAGYNWVSLGTAPAVNNALYNYEARTPWDSSINGNGTFFFRVTALTNTPGVFWRSNIMSGYSVDNLAPLPPSNLVASVVMNSAQLSWDPNPESDLRHYIIYRNGVQLGTSTVLTFEDNTILPDSVYSYTVAAQDVHGNIGEQSEPAMVSLIVSAINIKLIPEGLYLVAEDRLSVGDTVRIVLHNSISPFEAVDSSTAVIDELTFEGSFRFPNTPGGTYYIAVHHRNSIETWSRSGGELFTPGTVMNYDFTSAASQAFGNNMVQVNSSPVRYAIYGGDVNGDGTIDGSDAGVIDLDVFNYVSGYSASDLNGDDFVDASDLAIADNNAANFVGVIRP